MSTMPPVSEVTETQIIQFLAAARETIAEIPLCWLATRSAEGGTNARAVNSSAGAPGATNGPDVSWYDDALAKLRRCGPRPWSLLPINILPVTGLLLWAAVPQLSMT